MLLPASVRAAELAGRNRSGVEVQLLPDSGRLSSPHGEYGWNVTIEPPLIIGRLIIGRRTSSVSWVSCPSHKEFNVHDSIEISSSLSGFGELFKENLFHVRAFFFLVVLLEGIFRGVGGGGLEGVGGLLS